MSPTRRGLLVLLLLAWGGLPLAASYAQDGPFRDVSQTHWAYDGVQMLAQRGFFTGYPDGTFAGKKALTRYEFAVAIQRLVQDVQRRQGTEEAGLAAHDSTWLQKLVQEFSSELAMLGADVERLRANLRAMQFPWRFEPPDLAVVSAAAYPGVGLPDDPGYIVGQRLAAAEWARGEAVFYVTSYTKREQASRSTSVPYRVYGQQKDDPYSLSIIAGHNAEMQARLKRFGAPPRIWRPSVPREAPASGGALAGSPRLLRVSLDAPEVCSRDGRVLLRLEEHGARRPATLRITLPERAVLLSLEAPMRASQVIAATMEAADANLLRIAISDEAPGRGQSGRLWDVDLTTGAVRIR